ncbi:hydroxyethylthiazole kinase [Nocardioides zeae]|uniref:Hydroxyethylthiazole kinase n=1 Tax=Nocardioides zeae TaxID=1457234 RepID=A0ACC6IEX1_9ACTN|nr:hydroxyethylthiazole kinase [Nocardioides zeae]MDR6174892.1 hydroxyethylthiazole kinase [Nocardioides zeae]MDR6209298.1 hydroxyethylthiazole kinase [Nocardioides zeae]
MSTVTWPDQTVSDALAAVQATSPLTYGLTNYISAPLAANAILAVGGSPAFGALPGGIAHLATIASGVFLNLASLITDTYDDLRTAARAAHDAGTPWVLDPVVVGAGIAQHDAFAAELLELRPTAIRGNASEVLALAGGASTSKGVDATASTEEVVDLAAALARRTGAVVAVSGEVDRITDGTEVVAVPGGHPWLPRVTATGCALGGLTATFLGAGTAPLQAVVAAHAVLAVAAERAAPHARGTGTFAAALLDELSLLRPASQ